MLGVLVLQARAAATAGTANEVSGRAQIAQKEVAMLQGQLADLDKKNKLAVSSCCSACLAGFISKMDLAQLSASCVVCTATRTVESYLLRMHEPMGACANPPLLAQQVTAGQLLCIQVQHGSGSVDSRGIIPWQHVGGGTKAADPFPEVSPSAVYSSKKV